MNVSFDFDGTLHHNGQPLSPAITLLRWHHWLGHSVMIVTTRTAAHERPEWSHIHEPDRVLIHDFVKRYRLPVGHFAFTEHTPKAATLVGHDIDLHYDNDPAEASAAAGTGVRVIILIGDTFHVGCEWATTHYCRR